MSMWVGSSSRRRGSPCAYTDLVESLLGDRDTVEMLAGMSEVWVPALAEAVRNKMHQQFLNIYDHV